MSLLPMCHHALWISAQKYIVQTIGVSTRPPPENLPVKGANWQNSLSRFPRVYRTPFTPKFTVSLDWHAKLEFFGPGHALLEDWQ